MPTDPGAVDRFLHKSFPKLPDFKAMSPERCAEFIRGITGAEPVFVTDPRPHQLQGLAMALYVERALIFFDMRSGKTKLALDWASHLGMTNQWTGRGLIVVPSPILTDVWVSQAKRHSVLRVRGVGPRVEDLVASLDDPDTDLTAISWSALQMIFSEKVTVLGKKGKPDTTIMQPCFEMLTELADMLDLVIFDEIHTAKNHESLRFMIGAGLVAKARFRLGLTGTPWGRDPMAAWAQAFLVDGGETLSRNYYFFQHAFGKQIVVGFKNRRDTVFDKDKLPILQDKLSHIAMSYRRVDQGEGVFEGVVELDIRGEQRKAYQDGINRMMTTPAGDRMKLNNMFVRLRQIASGFLPFIDEEGVERIVEFNSSKMDWLQDFISNLEPNIKCVFFHEFTLTGERICKALERAKVIHSWLYGGTKDRVGTVASFERGAAQVIVVQAASGGMGIELLAADYQCFFESPLSTITRTQAERRAQGERNGRSLMIDDLICAPVERHILELVREGKDTLGELYKDPEGFAKRLQLR